ncbi:MAG TPA: polysaccharide biosynthesis C-terminal domain-containing protein, partial [Patescibacteria group bacterium]|nr:polysaccharide biosynthesis C-terminal domain-containing protein [Patescibacteria group bacterium]
FLIIFLITNPDTGLLGIAQASLFIDTLCIVLLLWYTVRLVKPKIQTQLIWPMMKQAYTFTLYNIFFMLYFQIDQIILSIMVGKSEVGIYSAAAKLVTMFLFIPMMLFQVTMPILYRYSKTDINKFKHINLITFRYLAALGIPAGIVLWFLSDTIIPLVFGEKYLAAIPVLSIFGWFLAIRFLGMNQGNALTTMDKQGLRATIQIISLVINVILDIVLIRYWGAVGAAIATLITEMLISVSSIILCAHFLKESLLQTIRSLAPILGATLALWVILFLAKPYVSAIILLILAVVSYLFFLWIFRFFTTEDKQLIRHIVQKN